MIIIDTNLFTKSFGKNLESDIELLNLLAVSCFNSSLYFEIIITNEEDESLNCIIYKLSTMSFESPQEKLIYQLTNNQTEMESYNSWALKSLDEPHYRNLEYNKKTKRKW
jgi:hypothetical protein